MSDSAALSRQEQKERTRAALLDAALELSQRSGFAQISLRQVAKEAGVVPAAFYRHFASMDDLGLALVERSFATLRRMIRDAQRDPDVFNRIIDAAADVLVEAVKEHKAHFAFVARERVGGSAAVREAIAHELDLFVSELSVVLARLPNIENWSSDDVHMVARLFVRNMVANAEEVVEMPDGRPDLEAQIKEGARRQMRLIVLGFEKWHS
ncbi:TetR family transcriptional regulator [Aeromicrobium sp. YIM 150415]|uniref:TetR family transcriptional regulator n=1 Tax=Aeromicrobium piscarium TaxID=2590901 RepID=A0A554S919_9ACTN|nr:MULTISPECIES: TetR family transcriptional regulator [Aeromicrobium]MBM9464464.1 TetR family transcriptional regulator [Aeromicrobium sp. YIM 150415]TSD62839.1 TetR family transcriptional regulator [Aeromicrobium piscarium]